MESILDAEYLGYQKMNTSIKNNKSYLFTRMRKRVIERFQRNEFDSLKKDIKDNAVEQHLKDFFSSLEGRGVISWVIISRRSQPLNFLYENIASDILQEALRYKNFSVLEGYLLGASNPILSKLTEDDRKSRIEKFLILLKIDGQEVKNFFDDFESRYSANAENKEEFKKLKDDFESAYEQFKQQNLSLKL